MSLQGNRGGISELREMVEGGGFEPPKAEPTDLQSVPFDHSGTPPDTIFTKKS